LKNQGLKPNSIGIYMRNLRAAFNVAIKSGIIKQDDYPFYNYKIPKEKTRHRALSEEHIAALYNYCGTEARNRAKDILFLSMFLVGINMKDLLLAKKIQIYNNRLEYTRAKTGKHYTIAIQPEASEIIERYAGEKYLLHLAEKNQNHKYIYRYIDRRLHDICKELEIPVNVTTYYARHTWATIARNICKVPYDEIRLALGHYIPEVTGIYIDYDSEIVDQANRKVIDYVLQISNNTL